MGKDVLLLVTTGAILYGMWMLLGLVFQMIDVYHQRTSAAETRRGGSKQAEGMGDC